MVASPRLPLLDQAQAYFRRKLEQKPLGAGLETSNWNSTAADPHDQHFTAVWLPPSSCCFRDSHVRPAMTVRVTHGFHVTELGCLSFNLNSL